MADYWKTLWQRLTAQDARDKAEVERIAALQQAAVSRRAEYAQSREQAARAGEPSPSPSRKQVQEAEAAHTAALQVWQNRQSRQKSR